MILFLHGFNDFNDDRVPEGPTSFGEGGSGAASVVSGERYSEAVGVANVDAARVPQGIALDPIIFLTVHMLAVSREAWAQSSSLSSLLVLLFPPRPPSWPRDEDTTVGATG
jgi:hypothetical protein